MIKLEKGLTCFGFSTPGNPNVSVEVVDLASQATVQRFQMTKRQFFGSQGRKGTDQGTKAEEADQNKPAA